MPTYQYACTECGHEFEQFQSFSDDSLTHCPECDGRLRKVFNAVGVVFKGSGFYRTDSRSGATSSVAAGSDSGSSSSSDSSSDSKSASSTKSSSESGSGSGSGSAKPSAATSGPKSSTGGSKD